AGVLDAVDYPLLQGGIDLGPTDGGGVGTKAFPCRDMQRSLHRAQLQAGHLRRRGSRRLRRAEVAHALLPHRQAYQAGFRQVGEQHLLALIVDGAPSMLRVGELERNVEQGKSVVKRRRDAIRRERHLYGSCLQPLHSLALAGQREGRSEEHTSELQSRENLVCRLLLEKKKKEKKEQTQ